MTRDEDLVGSERDVLLYYLNRMRDAIEAASAQVFQKLDLEPSHDLNRRVLAVLTLLNN